MKEFTKKELLELRQYLDEIKQRKKWQKELDKLEQEQRDLMGQILGQDVNPENERKLKKIYKIAAKIMKLREKLR